MTDTPVAVLTLEDARRFLAAQPFSVLIGARIVAFGILKPCWRSTFGMSCYSRTDMSMVACLRTLLTMRSRSLPGVGSDRPS
jgi:hypothetical protein